jgi:cation transport protein ChaC
MIDKPIVTREKIRDGFFERMLTEQGGAVLRDKNERDASRREFLRLMPRGMDLWVFGYGSLIWNPTFHYSERRHARLYGYHRAFCIWVALGRGSPEQPGLMMGLDRGGSCKGVLFRLAPHQIEAETEVLWDREMLVSMYHPRWVSVKTEGGPVEAVTFVVDRAASSYSGRMSLEQQAIHIARANGEIGSSADYLFSLCRCFEAEGIRDRLIERLQRLVEADIACGD